MFVWRGNDPNFAHKNQIILEDKICQLFEEQKLTKRRRKWTSKIFDGIYLQYSGGKYQLVHLVRFSD